MDNATILIIDDDTGSLELLSSAIEECGYNVITAKQPLIGIKKAADILPELIILDWYMPDMDGLQVLKELKNQKTTREIPVVMATGINTESVYLKLALDAGAVDFIRKPFDEVELIARVKAALRLVNYYEQNREQLKTIHKQEKKIIKQKNEEYKKELEFKKQELINKALQLVQMMDSTTGMINKLKKLSLGLNEHDTAKINSVIKEFLPDSFEKKWTEFEKHFEEVHTDFYKKLLKDFPALSPNERKLCVYFKMDMENKDIAALTFSGYHAIRKARIRLKKKLGLTALDSLEEFLNSY